MSPRYAPLPNPSSNHDPERELEDAFELDDEDDSNDHLQKSAYTAENRRNQAPQPSILPSRPPLSIGGPPAYDFERQDYDFPPPGSPPRPSSRALPNDFGNSNGELPSFPVVPQPPRPSIFRRVAGALLPSHYMRVPSSESSQPRMGGGTENDGVFANVMAKPQRANVVRNEDGSIYVMPEESQKETPPTYAEAQADAVPPYWETTIHAPAGLDANGDMIIDDLPTGSFLIFALNLVFSFFFQFVGFVLTYMLHTTHAAKFGSRAGLGLTLIQYGFYSRVANLSGEDGASNADPVTGLAFPLVNATQTDPAAAPMPEDTIAMSSSSRDWLSFLFMTLGWFLLLSSCLGFWRVKRWESSVRAPPDPTGPEDLERDRDIRRNIASTFGIHLEDDAVHVPGQGGAIYRDENGNVIGHPSQQALEAEARLTRDLRAAGLI